MLATAPKPKAHESKNPAADEYRQLERFKATLDLLSRLFTILSTVLITGDVKELKEHRVANQTGCSYKGGHLDLNPHSLMSNLRVLGANEYINLPS